MTTQRTYRSLELLLNKADLVDVRKITPKMSKEGRGKGGPGQDGRG